MTLKTETNTPEMYRRVKHAANQLGLGQHQRLSAHFEHGQWWVMHTNGAAWSVCDASGSDGVYDGFCFEQIAEAEDF